MNKVHRVVWSKARGAFVVAHERVSPRGKGGSATRGVMAASIAAALLTLADPTAAQTTTITTPSGSQTLVTGETLVNESTISATNTRGVALLVTGGVVAGSITNNGTINALTNGTGVGILVTGSTLSGGITNAGMLNGDAGVIIRSGSSVASFSNSGVITGGALFSLSSVGSISNAAGATITGGLSLYAITTSSVVNAGSIAGGIGAGGGGSVASIQNTGTVNGSNGISLRSGAQVGSITNSGVINASSNGVYILSASSVASVVNQSGGVITGSSDGIIAVGGSVGTISNSAGATVTGGNGGVVVFSSAAPLTVLNAGVISAPAGQGVAIAATQLASLTNAGTISGEYGVELSDVTGGTVSNLAGGVISGSTFGLELNGSNNGSVAAIINSGTITSTGPFGYGFYVSSTSLGTFSNMAGGVVSGASAIVVSNSTVSAINNAGNISGTNIGMSIYDDQLESLVNTGTISGANTALLIQRGNVGSVANHGTISSGEYGAIISGANISGGVTNSGLISGTGEAGMVVQSATITGGINNLAGGVVSGASGLTLYFDVVDNIVNAATSTISGLTLNGVHVTSGSTVTGNIFNQGVISGGINGVYINSASTVMGQLQNSGTISGANDGVKIQSGSSLVGGIVNSGTITGTSAGIVVSSAAVIGNLSNTGLIHGTVEGISYLNNTAASGGVFNAGVISGGTVGIALVSSSIRGPITNMAGGTISGGQYGVALSKATVSGGLSNAGTISGGRYSVFTDGTTPLPITISGADTAAFIGDVKATSSDVTVTSGSTFTGTNAFDVQSFTVDSGATFKFGAMPSSVNGAAGVSVSEGLNNLGTVSVGLGKASLNGNYNQASTGVLALSAASDSSYGKLVAGGTAALAGNAAIFVSVATNNTLTNHETLSGVLQSGGLSASTFDVTDNSDLYSFKGLVDGNNVDLVVSIDAVLLPATIARGNLNAEGAARTFDEIITSSIGQGSFSPLINDLSRLQTPTALSHAASQLVPALSGEGDVAILGALHEMNSVMQSRTEGNLGLSSGAPYMSDSAAWVKPFGSWDELGSTGSAPGFSSGVEGVMLGGDGAISSAARIGLAFGYANADVSGKADSAPNHDRINLYQLMGYGSYIVMPGTEVSAEIDGGYDTNDTTRNIEFTGQKASASSNSTDAHFGIAIAHPFALSDSTTVVPSARVDYTWVQSDGYLEGGAGPINLQTGSTSYEQLITSVNGKLLQKVNEFMTLFGNVGIGYDSMARSNTAIVATFAGAPGLPFTTQGVGLKPQVFMGGFGVSSQAHGMTPEISAKYDVERRSGFSNQTVSFKARWAF